jgi:hypothetical protein
MAYSAEAARLRKQQQRERQRAAVAPVLYSRPDWRLFLNRNTLPQKAGCELRQIGRVVLKELVDNALDAGADEVTLTGGDTSCQLTDDGPGIDDVAILFAVNRPLISSKLRRLPTRGMLGNGLRVVEMPALPSQGTRIERIELTFPQPLFDEEAYKNARTTGCYTQIEPRPRAGVSFCRS